VKTLKSKFKKLAKNLLRPILSVLPVRTRLAIFRAIVVVLKSELSPKEEATFLLSADNLLYQFIGNAAVRWGKGTHPKFALIGYSDFFLHHLGSFTHLLDLGCGTGLLAQHLLENNQRIHLTAVDHNLAKVNEVKMLLKKFSSRTQVICANIEHSLPDIQVELIILSNVLEHVKDRRQFLNRLMIKYQPKRILIRVPSYERDWKVPFKKILSVDYFLDPDHTIEFTEQELYTEMKQCGLTIRSLLSKWGELWAVAEPIDNRA
jgi:2-polyprenyl-3-methyl-5-hydroxy-6-metoxy-1,4-benzoquinol methylase